MHKRFSLCRIRIARLVWAGSEFLPPALAHMIRGKVPHGRRILLSLIKSPYPPESAILRAPRPVRYGSAEVEGRQL